MPSGSDPKIPEQQQIQAGDEGKPADNKRADTTPIARAIIEVRDSILQEYRANQQTQHRENQANRRIATAAVVGAWIYAAIAAFQWFAMLAANKQSATGVGAAVRAADTAQLAVQDARNNFRRDQRPYIWMANMTVGPSYDVTRKEIVWNWFYANYGKTPAYQSKGRQFMKLGTGPFKFSSLHGDIAFAPLPPNRAGEYDTVFSQPGVTPEEFQAFMQVDGGIQMRVDISYSDSYGGQYYTGFCFSHNANGSVQYCDNTYMK